MAGIVARRTASAAVSTVNSSSALISWSPQSAGQTATALLDLTDKLSSSSTVLVHAHSGSICYCCYSTAAELLQIEMATSSAHTRHRISRRSPNLCPRHSRQAVCKPPSATTGRQSQQGTQRLFLDSADLRQWERYATCLSQSAAGLKTPVMQVHTLHPESAFKLQVATCFICCPVLCPVSCRWAPTGTLYGFTTNPLILHRDGVPCTIQACKQLLEVVRGRVGVSCTALHTACSRGAVGDGAVSGYPGWSVLLPCSTSNARQSAPNTPIVRA